MAGKRHCWDLRREMSRRRADEQQKQQAAKCLARDNQRLAVMWEWERKEERRRHIWQVKEKPRETQVESALLKRDKADRSRKMESERGAAVEKEATAQEIRERKKVEEEEEAFRKKMMAKFVEDDRIEQMGEQKRRKKQLQHKRAVVELIQDRRRQHQANVELEAKERAIEQARKAMQGQIDERKSSTAQ